MLGVRRVAITSAAKEMQGRGLIDYGRGTVTALDPHGLKSVSCSFYKTDQQFYTTLLRDPRLDRNPQPKQGTLPTRELEFVAA